MGYSEPGHADQPNDDETPPHVDLLLCVDAETLLTQHPNASHDPQAPTLIEGAFVYAIGPKPHGLTESHGDLLDVHAQPGQILRIRTVALALRAEQTVVVYQFELEHHACLTPPAQAVEQGLLMSAENATCPTQMHTLAAEDYFWRSKVIAQGDSGCALDLMLVDPACKASGYFRWATTLRVSHA